MTNADLEIRSLRAAKPPVDVWRAHGSLVEEERRPEGTIERALTVFLAGAECAFTCSFCDLWRYTIDGPTPVGALPKQIDDAITAIPVPPRDRIKLYNASNFFDPRAVPASDLPRIIALCAPFGGVTVESHARTVGRSAIAFARQLRSVSGTRLEVAMGLETIHPDALAKSNKKLDIRLFDDAAARLRDADIDLRVFVLLGAPRVPRGESIDWTVRTAVHAAERGAAVVSIIPVRGGNGEMERLAALGEFVPPALVDVEAALDASIDSRAVVTVDLWDIEKLSACSACREARVDRLRRMNLTGVREPPVACALCAAAPADAGMAAR